jgi:hypothetical protein
MNNFTAKDQKIDHVNNKLYTTINIPYSTIHAVNVSRIDDSEVSRRGLSNNYKHYCNLEIITPNKVETITVAENEGLATLVNNFTNICHLLTIEDDIKHQKIINLLETECKILPIIYFSNIKSFESKEVKSFATIDGEITCTAFYDVAVCINDTESRITTLTDSKELISYYEKNNTKAIRLTEEKYLSFIKHFSLYQKYKHDLQKNIPDPIYFNFHTFIVYSHIETHNINECTNSDNKKGANVDIIFKNNDKNLTIFLDDDNLKYFKKGQKEWENYISNTYSSDDK